MSYTPRLFVDSSVRVLGPLTVNKITGESAPNITMTVENSLKIGNTSTKYLHLYNDESNTYVSSEGTDLSFLVGSEKLKILQTGNVGIGTSTPSDKLEVSGNTVIDGTISVSGGIKFPDGSSQNSAIIDGSGFTGVLNSTLSVSGTTTLSSTLSVSGLTIIGSGLSVAGNITAGNIGGTWTGTPIRAYPVFPNVIKLNNNNGQIEDQGLRVDNILSVSNTVTFGSTLSVSGNIHGANIHGTWSGDSVRSHYPVFPNVLKLNTNNNELVAFSIGGKLNDTLSVSGAAVLKSSLSVSGDTTISSQLSVSTLYVNGSQITSGSSFNGVLNGSLSVSGATTLSSTLSVSGEVFVGTRMNMYERAFGTGSDNLGFAIRFNGLSDAEYGFGQAASGESFINAPSTQDIKFRINDLSKMVVKRDGKVGIGIMTPSELLEVSGNAYINGTVSGTSFNTISDSRIKTNINNANISNCIDIVNNIPLRNYNYIDTNKRGTSTVHGYIAQEVNTYLPECITIKQDYLPDIYMNGYVSMYDDTSNSYKLRLTGTVPVVNTGDVLKIIDTQNGIDILNVIVTSISVSETSMETEIIINNVSELSVGSTVFIYGRRIDDLHTIDKTKISILHHGAVQYLYQENQKMKSDLANLTAIVNQLL